MSGSPLTIALVFVVLSGLAGPHIQMPRAQAIPYTSQVQAEATAEAAQSPTLVLLPLPEDVAFHFQGQTPEHEALMRAGVQATYSYLRSVGLEADPGRVDLFAYADSALLVNDMFELLGRNEWTLAMQANLRSSHPGGHGDGFAVMWTEFMPALSQHGDSNYWFMLLGHVYIEAVLEMLAGHRPISETDGSPAGEPAWMLQGLWSYLGARASDAAGMKPYLAYRAEARQESRRLTATLAAFETHNNGDPVSVGFLADEYLSAHAGGDGSFLVFYRNLGQGMNKYDAFRAAFGMSFSEFYEQYRAYRLEHYPVFYQFIGGAVADARGNGVENIWVWACPIQPEYDCYPARSLANGDFFNDVPQGTIRVAFGTTPDPASIFGYFRQGEGVPPTPAADDPIIIHYYDIAGTMTADLGEATLLPISTDTLDSFSHFGIYVIVPEGMRPSE